MAHKKGVGSTDNGRDSISKRLGVKLFGGQQAKAGNIIIRQRGTKFHAGENVYMAKDHTLHAKVDGTISFRKKRKGRTFVNIIPFEEIAETVAPVETAKKTTPVEKSAPAEPVEKTAAPAAEETKTVEETPAEEQAPEAKAEPATPAEKPAEEPTAEAEQTTEKAEETPVEKKKPAKKVKADDLKIIEGVGPKIESLMKEAGFEDLRAVANASLEDLKKVLEDAGSRYQMHDPTTWSKQAELAADEKWEELQEYQDHLKGGKEPDADEKE